jgi:uncharacterized OB-fold protein
LQTEQFVTVGDSRVSRTSAACPTCGTARLPGENFCQSCGTKFQ